MRKQSKKQASKISKVYFIIGVALAVISTFGAGAISPVTKVNQPKVESTSVWEEWMTAAQEIAQNSNDPQAIGVYAYLRNHTASVLHFTQATPDGQGANFGGTAMQTVVDGAISFVPITAADAVNPFCALHYQHPAVFDRQYKMIFVSSDRQWSKFLKGIMLLHEGFHAQAFTVGKNAEFTGREYEQEERRITEMEHNLMLKLGGTAYQKLLAKEEILVRQQLLAGQEWVPEKYNTQLDQIFGPAIEEEEKMLRQQLFQLQAHFNLYNNTPGQSQRKDLLLYQLMVNSGVIDPTTDRLIK